MNDNFFDLGGDSILNIQIIARANQAGLQLTPGQLFQNLISNSIKFQQSDVTPWVEIENVPDPDGAKEFCRIAVSDNGIGFDEVYLDHIFTIFQRLHTRREYEGTGIGLAICRRIVERHNGRITAHSRPGMGSTFIVTLPLKQNTVIE